RSIPLAAAKPQALLVAGLLVAGRVVSVDRLVEAHRGASSPITAPALVKSYVSLLRRALHRPGEPPVIITRPPGYLVRVESGKLDLPRFESLLAAGGRATA